MSMLSTRDTVLRDYIELKWGSVGCTPREQRGITPSSPSIAASELLRSGTTVVTDLIITPLQEHETVRAQRRRLLYLCATGESIASAEECLMAYLSNAGVCGSVLGGRQCRRVRSRGAKGTGNGAGSRREGTVLELDITML